MNSTENIENVILDNTPTASEEEIKRNKYNKPFKAQERHLENGKYNSKPLDKEYFNKYYHEKRKVQIQCPRCGKNSTNGNLSKHQLTKSCLMVFTEQKTNEVKLKEELKELIKKHGFDNFYVNLQKK